MTLGRPKRGKGVNTGVDSVLRLVPLSGLPTRESDPWRVRALQAGKRCDAVEAFARWLKDSPDEARRIAAKLRKMAASEDELKLSTVKRVGPGRKIIEVKGRSARLFCFQENDRSTLTIICVKTFWIGGGNKTRRQDDAIGEAVDLMERWQAATPIAGYPDHRLEIDPGKKGDK